MQWRWAAGAALPVKLVDVVQQHKLVGCRLQACYSSEDRAAGHELPVVATALSTWDACAALQRMEPAILPSSDAKIRRCKACRPTQLRVLGPYPNPTLAAAHGAGHPALLLRQDPALQGAPPRTAERSFPGMVSQTFAQGQHDMLVGLHSVSRDWRLL